VHKTPVGRIFVEFCPGRNAFAIGYPLSAIAENAVSKR